MRTGLIILLTVALIGQAFAQKKIVVAQDGSGNFKTVQEAVNAVPDNSSTSIEIFVKKGTYKERVIIAKEKTNIDLVGEDAATTILTFDNYALRLDSTGKALGTSRTASFYVYAANFTAKNITFENTAGPVGQALAIYVDGDRDSFFNCRFLGFQDTIYTHGIGSSEYYSNCYIEGTTDFIFGSATALFENCSIFCKAGGHYIAAASTPDTVKYGYVFMHCKITGNAPINTIALGRPWRPFAKTVYLFCSLSEVILPAGWDNWRNAANEKTAFYAEYKNKGPGFQPAQRADWSHQLTDEEAKAYQAKNILNGWEPKTL